ncbi:MAG: Mrp/NBP35 family ATP-binding protein [Chloroflexi bacterium]|nr:Mrp/NBP35 family ATP-binding protein [Chloroflexota bacterium]MBM3167456.1 Mrp/NBP35 family ATP-binding protein [Chloroflexota bacterium]MBM3174076.1 Mrp/NBP35 family ATP-binding protein [Chloroflexota bacterium]MBM4452838.1 Mrp/NBP35 family ATP-binding protein [Chloroflexota bacterium]
MTTKEQAQQILNKILVPGAGRSLAELNLVRNIKITDNKVDITLASAALNPDTQSWIKTRISDATKQLTGLSQADITFVEAKPSEVNEVRSVIAVMSGKGGVGKSLVTALLGIALARKGKKVGILDADITGPSIPKMFGLSNQRPSGSDTGILPVLSKTGISVMSINLVLPHEDDAVIWRGPLIGKAIQQFWEEVLWGKLDCLIVDLPPGTADAPLTVMQSLSVSGVVIVLSPQELAVMVVRKAVKMAQQMNVPILGVVENMSYFILPDSGKKLELFGRSRGAEMAEMAGAPLLAQIPIDPRLAELCDAGEIEKYSSEAFDSLARNFARVLAPKAKKKS